MRESSQSLYFEIGTVERIARGRIPEATMKKADSYSKEKIIAVQVLVAIGGSRFRVTSARPTSTYRR